jgi:hypothetical protein
MGSRGSAYNGGPGYPAVEAKDYQQVMLHQAQVNWDTARP